MSRFLSEGHDVQQQSPASLDFFPKTRRGHGTTHPTTRYTKAGLVTREAHKCSVPQCERNTRTGKGEQHRDQQANAADWREEHGVSKHTPLEQANTR